MSEQQQEERVIEFSGVEESVEVAVRHMRGPMAYVPVEPSRLSALEERSYETFKNGVAFGVSYSFGALIPEESLETVTEMAMKFLEEIPEEHVRLVWRMWLAGSSRGS